MSFLLNLLAAGLLGLTSEYALENTNIAGYADDAHFTDFNRLRADITVKPESYQAVDFKLLLDNTTRYAERPADLINAVSIYRGYLEYRGETHYWVAGRQRIPLGVGKVWNPIDIFNPINSQAIEPEERPGTEALHYEYAMARLANLDLTVSREKGEARIKGYLDCADLAVVGLYDNDAQLDIIGWEMEGELFDTGIELRSEGGSFYDRLSGRRHTDFIVGAEYGFADSLTLLGEYRFNDIAQTDDLAVSASFQPKILWTVTCLLVESLNDHSFFVAPSVAYSTSDESELSAGAFVYQGGSREVYGALPDRFYVRWFVHF